MVESKPVRVFRTARARGGPARQALASAVDGRDLSGMDAITWAIARDAADLVDSARDSQDPRLWSSASQRLLGLVDRLDRGRSGDRGNGGGDTADEPDELAEALGAGPEMGDGS